MSLSNLFSAFVFPGERFPTVLKLEFFSFRFLGAGFDLRNHVLGDVSDKWESATWNVDDVDGFDWVDDVREKASLKKVFNGPR